MRSSTLIFAAAVATGSTVAAETVNILLPVFGSQNLVAKSIGGDSVATTYVLGCEAGTPSDECGLPAPMVIVQGPKTLSYNLDIISTDSELGDMSFNQGFDCSLAGTTLADCTATMDGPIMTNTNAIAGDGSRPRSSDARIFSGTNMDNAFQQVTLVKEANSIMNYGFDANGKPTSYGGAAAAAVETGATQTAMVTSKATLPSQTGSAVSNARSVMETLLSSKTSSAVSSAKSGMETLLSSKTSSAAADASGVATSTSAGFAAQVTGLGAFAAAAVGAVIAMAAL